MAKNFDYLLLLAERVPGFKRLHEYCDMAESLKRLSLKHHPTVHVRHMDHNHTIRILL